MFCLIRDFGELAKILRFLIFIVIGDGVKVFMGLERMISSPSMVGDCFAMLTVTPKWKFRQGGENLGNHQ